MVSNAPPHAVEGKAGQRWKASATLVDCPTSIQLHLEAPCATISVTINLHGFVFKSKSPSSGLYRVKVYTEEGMPSHIGTGIFPRQVMRRFPLLPLEEEGCMHDMHLRENFIDRVFAYYRWTCLLADNPTPANALQHLMGFLKDDLSKEDKAELMAYIEDYRQGLAPLIVPLTLLTHHLKRHAVPDWVHQQVYLRPYPKELLLRNHV